MLIESNTRRDRAAAGQHRRWFGKRTKIALLAIGLLSAVSLLLIVGGMLGVSAERQKLFEKLARVDVVATVRNYFDGLGADPEEITIDIKHKHYEQLSAWRDQAMERGQITSDLKDYVPATIRYRDQQMKAKLRLKGEWTDHLSFNKWSLRIKISGDDSLFGMKSFSIQHPRTRSYLYEWIYHEALRREGIAAQRYKFVRVTVNGRHQGIFAVEENFAKQLIESNERREGVIVRFNSDFRYQPFSHVPGVNQTSAVTGIQSPQSTNIQVYDEEKVAEDPKLQEQYLVAHNLLESFRAGRLPTHMVFDADKLAMYFAISELTGGTFAAYDWSDMRLLYNPVTSRLEPIGVEGNVNPYAATTPVCTDFSSPDVYFHKLMFEDESFFRKYVAALEKVSAPAYVDAMLADLDEDLRKQLQIIHSEWPYWQYSPEVLRNNAESLRGFLNPNKGLHAYYVGLEGQQCELEVGAIQAMPIEVLTLTAGDGPNAVTLTPSSRLVLAGKVSTETVDYQRASFAIPANTAWTDEWLKTLKIQYRILGSNIDRVADVFPQPRLDEARLQHDLLRHPPNPEQFTFLKVVEPTKTITIVPGQHLLNEIMVLPEGYTVVAGPGTQLDLAEGAKIITYSPLRLIGSEEQPVVIQSPDATGQGLTVLNAGEKSLLEYVTFRNLTNPSQAGWSLTGAVTFYCSPVELRHCEFLDNHCEDALNIFRCEFVIDQSLFQNTPSDAFDGDFVTGVVRRSSFVNVRGDCVDVSGSRVQLADLYIRDASDKGISLGEASSGSGERIRVERAGIGIAAKDLSSGVFTDVHVTDAEFGAAVYEKKPEFGGGKLQFSQLTFERVKTAYVVEQGSTMIVDDKELPPTDADVKQQLYGDGGVSHKK